jgi:hypothetical protein
MSNPSVANQHTNGNHTDPVYRHNGEAQDTWKQEHSKYTGWRQQEPPFLHSVKWHDLETGIEHLTVIRADDLDSLFVQVRTVTPMVRMAKQKAQDAPETQETLEGWCGFHNVQMTRSKDGNGFYHKAGEKQHGKAIWCRGK